MERKSGSGPKTKSHHPFLFPGGPVLRGILSRWQQEGDPVWGGFCIQPGQWTEVDYPKAKAGCGGNTRDRNPTEEAGSEPHWAVGPSVPWSRNQESQAHVCPCTCLPLNLSSMAHHIGCHFTDSNMYLPPRHTILGGHWSHGIKYLGEELPQKVGVGPHLTGGVCPPNYSTKHSGGFSEPFYPPTFLDTP